MVEQLKTVYVLRVRPDDNSPWSEPAYYRTCRQRKDDEQINRCLLGVRTHSYEEKKTPEEIEELCD